MCLLNTGRELLTGNKQGLCCKTLDCWMLQAAGARREEAFYQKIGAFLLGEELNTANRQWTSSESWFYYLNWIKQCIVVYYEQSVTTKQFEDFDGERWIMSEDWTGTNSPEWEDQDYYCWEMCYTVRGRFER